MDFRLTPEQEEIRELAARFSKEVCVPEAAEIDNEHRFPMETWKKMAELGFLGVNQEEKYGGVGHDPIAKMLIIEELSKASLTHGAMYALLGHGFTDFIAKFGTEEQKMKYITPVIERGMIGAFCLTEPGAGSDALGIRTKCVKDGDDYIINGTKCFITAGNLAEHMVVVTKADAKAGETGFNGFIVDASLPGVSIGKIEVKMGIRGLPTTEVIFEDVRVPKECMLGGPAGQGEMMKFALGALDAARIGTGAQALGVATAAYEAALKYSTERVQFGKPLNANQGIRWYLAEMATKLQISRHLVYHAAWLEQQGLPYSKEAAMAKLYCSMYGREVVNTALQIHGGYGYMNDYPLERMYRDIKITEIYEGASEVLKIVISNNIIPKPPKKNQ